MSLSVTIPPEVEAALRAAGLDPAAAFREAALVQLYIHGVIGRPELRMLLNLDGYELDGLLKRHGVDFMPLDEVRDEIARIRGHTSRAAS